MVALSLTKFELSSLFSMSFYPAPPESMNKNCPNSIFFLKIYFLSIFLNKILRYQAVTKISHMKITPKCFYVIFISVKKCSIYNSTWAIIK